MPIEPVLSAKTEFLGIDFADHDFDDIVDRIAALSRNPYFSYIVTPNVDHVVRLNGSGATVAQVRAAYDGAALRVCDSRVLARLARLFGVELVVMPGSDLTSRLFADVFTTRDRVAIIGGRHDTVTRLERLYPQLNFLQHIPPMGLAGDPAGQAVARSFVDASRADYVLFAIGSPQSELLACQCRDGGGARGVGLCIGASIDFLVGDQARAPAWLQRAGFEWLYRLLGDPRRLAHRYLIDGPKVFAIAARWNRARVRR